METLEEALEKLYPENIIKLGNNTSYDAALIKRKDFTEGAKWQAERMYSKEDLEEAFKAGREGDMVFNNESPEYWDFNQWFEQFKKK